MNPINLTEETARALDIAYPDHNREQVPKMQKSMRTAPLLTYTFSDVAESWTKQIDELQGRMDRVVMPYPAFRFHIAAGVEKWSGICECPEAGMGLRAVFVGVRRDEKYIMKIFHDPPRVPGSIGWHARLFDYSGHEITMGHLGAGTLPPKQQAALDRTVIRFLGIINLVAMEYMRPSNHIATVRPDKPGKSVQWVQAREHYTIIHRTHAANTKGVALGAVIAQDEAKHLQRVAHSRRAHERVLRSDYWKAAKGRVIQVKATWVGPPEWKDTAGQIYRIVERR